MRSFAQSVIIVLVLTGLLVSPFSSLCLDLWGIERDPSHSHADLNENHQAAHGASHDQHIEASEAQSHDAHTDQNHMCHLSDHAAAHAHIANLSFVDISLSISGFELPDIVVIDSNEIYANLSIPEPPGTLIENPPETLL